MGSGPKNKHLFGEAVAVIPGGVNSPVRAFKSVGGEPYFVARASGSRVTDEDGNTYIDFVQSWGASILGHANPIVLDAIAAAAKRGTTFGAPTRNEVRLAQQIVAAVPGAEMVRLVSSGTEAAMTAIRLARAVTGREKVVKFSGCYHGHSDALLAEAGSGVASLSIPGSAGVTKSTVSDTFVFPYNTVPRLSEETACVIVEPVAANMGLVAPEPGFLEGLRRACDDVGALLIFDEVISGFRLGRSGAAGLYSVVGDLSILGKVIGGGLPLAAIAGTRQVMEELAPLGPVYQAGTLSGNPLATAAGLSVLGELDESAYKRIESSVCNLSSRIEAVFREVSIPVEVPVVSTLFSVRFTNEKVRDYAGAKRAAENGLYARFFREMLSRGVALAPSPYEVAFTSLAHTEEDIDETIAAARSSALALVEPSPS